MSDLILSYDVGTTGVKTCLFKWDSQLSLLAYAFSEYSLTIGMKGEAEQKPKEWWQGMKATTREVLLSSGAEPSAIKGIAFCSQMQGLVLADEEGRPLRPAMSYMDQRATAQKNRFMNRGPKIQGLRVDALARGLMINGAVPASVKDPIWKYLWVKENEPELFSRVRYWFDVKEYLIFLLTGRATMTKDSAFATFLYDSRPQGQRWDNKLIRKYGVDSAHLPEVMETTDQAGELQAEPAKNLGLAPGTAVFASGGDATLIALGSGTVEPGETHIYTGTSGWVSTIVEKRQLDLGSMIASVPAAMPGMYNYFAEQETAGKCLQWVKDHLALDEINVFLHKKTILDNPACVYKSLYDYLVETISSTPAGSKGVIFTPWLHGNRSPFEDPAARGMFFNISIETGKRALIRSVMEGIMYNQRWLLESIERKVKTLPVLRFIGGGAQNPYLGQMLANITGRPIEIPENPQYSGAFGAATIAAIGLGLFKDFKEAAAFTKIQHFLHPDLKEHQSYCRSYSVFKRLYQTNKQNFHTLNAEVV